MSETTSGQAGRAPHGAVETILANCRPQPALPAVLTLFATVLLPAVLAQPQAGESAAWLPWLVAAGIVVSCALAVAAGFCSLFPQAAWIALAFWGLSLLERAAMPGFLAVLMYAGIATALAMAALQVWRIVTRRFVPTVTEPDPCE